MMCFCYASSAIASFLLLPSLTLQQCFRCVTMKGFPVSLSLVIVLVSMGLDVSNSSTVVKTMSVAPLLDDASSTSKNATTEVLPPVDSWPHRPLFLQTAKNTIIEGLKSSEHPCPVGVPFEFETDLFKGRALIRFRDLESSDNRHEDRAYFNGRKRLSQFIIQGQFKKSVKVSDMVTGREFDKPLKLVPPPFINRVIRRILGRVAPSVEIDLSSKTPKVIANFPGSVQTMRADIPGTEPDIASVEEIQEDTTLMFQRGSKYREGLTVSRRKRLFSDPIKASRYSFDTQKVYTFNNFDDSIDYVDYSINLKVYRFDLTSTLDGQPFQVMAKSKKDGKHLWAFHIWNERLLHGSEW